MCGWIIIFVKAIINTHKKDNVNDDENIFDKVNAATSRITSLWFLDFDLFLRWLLFTLLLLHCAAVFALVIVVVIITDIVVVIIVMIVGCCAILGS